MPVKMLIFERNFIITMENFGIIGGDKRQLYLAKSMQKDGYKVYICGFELSGDTKGLEEISLRSINEKCENIILPLPCTRDFVHIFAPYSSYSIKIDDDLMTKWNDKVIYGGCLDYLTKKNPELKKLDLQDYYLREDLAFSNAVPTAEGAIALAINEHPSALNNSKCLVTGYGRIGKLLSKNLRALGAKVDVAARKSKDIAMIRAMGSNGAYFADIKDEYDIIFNTVPDLVIGEGILSKQSTDTVIIELASLPGGVDKTSANKYGIKIVDGQSLPGKVSPKASAEYIKEAIYNMIKER